MQHGLLWSARWTVRFLARLLLSVVLLTSPLSAPFIMHFNFLAPHTAALLF